MRALRGIWWVIAVCVLAAGSFVAGGRMWASWQDVHAYAGVDLSNRLGAARTLDEGIDPYTYRNARYGQPGPPELVKRWNEHPYSPTLIWAYVPIGRLPFEKAREVDFWLEWMGLALAVGGLSVAFRGADRWAWVGLALALIVHQFSWRLHVERGQAYVFLTMLAGTGLAMIAATKRGRGGGLLRAAGAILVGTAAATRPSLAVLIVLLPLCGRWRQAIVATLAAAAVVGLTFLAGDRGHWAGYVRVVERLEREMISPGTLNSTEDGALGMPDPTLADAYEIPAGQRRIRSRSGNLVANTLLWPELKRQRGWPEPEAYPQLSKQAAIAWIGLAAGLITLLWLRGSTPLDRIAVMSAMAVAVDFFLPVRYEYADVLYLIPLGLCLAAMRARQAIVLPLLIAASLWMTMDRVDELGVEGSPAFVWRAITMVMLPAGIVVAVAILRGCPIRAEASVPPE
ncbi:MAG: hypothetical protein JWM57_1701 [Phycisphaerales bacterium]|nr:hypothetical protein [Phycisphaerales bacterium]